MAECRPICPQCDEEFGSFVELEEHQREQTCPLQCYGCSEQTSFCNRDEHCVSESHLRALKLSFEYKIEEVTRTKSTDHKKWIQGLTSLVTGTNHPSTHLERNAVHLTTRIETEHFDHSSRLETTKEQKFVSIQQQRAARFKESIVNRLDRLEIREEEEVSSMHVDQQWKEKHSELERKCLDYCQENQNLTFMNDVLDTQLQNFPHSTNGLLIWPIDNLFFRIRDAISRKAIRIDSPVFSMTIDGHRLCAQLYPNGYSNFSPKFISLHVMLTTRQTSSFRARITYCLVDQSGDRQHLVRTCDVDTNEIGIPFGFSDFIPAIDVHMEGSRFVRNDLLYILIKADQTKENQWIDHPVDVQDALRRIHNCTRH